MGGRRRLFPLWMACPPPTPCADSLPSSLPLHAPDPFSLSQLHSSLSCPMRTKSQLWRKWPWPWKSTRVTTLPKPHRSIFYLFIYLFLAVLGLRFCARAFSSCGKRGPLFIAVHGPLTIAASLVAEHRLQTRRLSSCGSRA